MHVYWMRRMDPNLDLGSSGYTFSSNNPLSYREGRRKSSLRDIDSEAGTLELSVINPTTKYATLSNSKSHPFTTMEDQLGQQRLGSFAHVNYVAPPQPTRQSRISV